MQSADETNPKLQELSNSAFFAGLAALIVLYLLICSYQLSQLPLIDPDEPRYAAAGRTMARGGSWLVPEFNDEKRINKPPLFYWMVAASMKITGRQDEIAARLPSIGMGLLMLLGTAFLGRRVYGAKTGLTSAGILASMALFAALSRACITDMTLSVFVAGGLGLVMLLMLERGPPRLLFWGAATAFGLGVLTKATPALALVAVLVVYRAISLPRTERAWARRPVLALFFLAMVLSILAIYCSEKHSDLSDKGRLTTGTAEVAEQLTRANQWGLADDVFNGGSLLLAFAAIACVVALAWKAGLGPLKRQPWLVGSLIALICGAWWYLALIQLFGWTEFKRLIEFEVAERLAGGVHREAMHYYFGNLTAVILPWSLLLPGAIYNAWPKGESAHESSPSHHADRFLLAWVAGIVLFFSIPGAKLATYVLPAFPALALLIGRFIVRMSSADERIGKWSGLITWILSGLFCTCVAVIGFIPIQYPDDFMRFLKALDVPFGVLGLAFGVSLAVSWWIASKRPFAGVFAVYLVTIGFVLAAAHAAIPVFLLGRSNRDLCMRIKNQITDCKRIVSYGADREGAVFYLDRAIVESRRRRTEANETIETVIREELSAPGRSAILIQRRYYARMVGMKAIDLPLDVEALKKTAPDYAVVVDGNNYVVVLKSK